MPKKGYVKTPQHRENLSKSLTGKSKSPTHRENLSKANIGKIMEEETKEKISKALKGRTGVSHGPLTDSHKKKVSDGLAGKPKSDLHKEKLSKAVKLDGRRPPNPLKKGDKVTDEWRRNIILSKTPYLIDINWLLQFEDLDKFMFLTCSINNKRDFPDKTTEFYKCFVEKFYVETNFNRLYNYWLLDGKKNTFLKPSVDHIIPKAKGGTNDLENLQFLSWLENKCKGSISSDQWEDIKNNIGLYFNLNEDTNGKI